MFDGVMTVARYGFTGMVALAALVGLAFLLAGARHRRRARKLARDGRRVEAVVTQNRASGLGDGRLSFQPVVRFVDADGCERHATVPAPSSRSYLAGTPMAVVYDPRDPDRVEPADGKAGRGHFAAAGTFLLLALLVGLAAACLLGTGSSLLEEFGDPTLPPEEGEDPEFVEDGTG